MLLSMMSKSYLKSFIFGSLLVLGLAPFNCPIFCFIGFTLFILLLSKYKFSKESFYLGFYFGLGYFSCGLYWLYNAFLVLYNNQFNFLIFFTLTILCLALFFSFLSIYWGLASFFTSYIDKNLYIRIFSFSIFLSIAEYLRGHLFTGFPWNLIAYNLTFNLLFMQISAIINIYFLNFFAIFIFCSPAILFYYKFNKTTLCFLSLPVVFLLFIGIYGYKKLYYNIPHHLTKTPYIVSLIQPNINQKQKINEKYSAINFIKLIKLIKQNNNPNINLIICPETAIDFLLNYSFEAKKYIKDSLFPNQLLLLGAPRADKNNKIYNSALLINSSAEIISYSDKLHLVPFGEYLPFKQFFSYINFISNFEAGKIRRTIKLNKDIYYLPLICYEAIFPNEMQYEGCKPNLIINITNDAWYGTSTGPFQHFKQAQMLAIEQNLPLIRVGNNGISALINASGKIIKKLNLNQTGVLTLTLHSIY